MSTPDELASAFRAADTNYEACRIAWNALSSPEERMASGIDIHVADLRREAAARALLAGVGNDHRIEEIAKVYLTIRDGKWALDYDGDALAVDGYERGPTTDCCDCTEGLDGTALKRKTEECLAVAEAASVIDPITKFQLRALLNATLA